MQTFRPLLLFVLLAAAAGLGAAEKPHAAKPVNSPARTSQTLADLQKAKAQNAADIARLKTKLKHAANTRAAHPRPEGPKDKRDSRAEPGEQDQLQLQQLMDQKAKLEDMISNLVKKTSDTSAGAVQNIK